MSRISVIMPLYNAAKFVNEALDSIKAQQGNFDFEVILVHGPSVDETKALTLAHDLPCIHVDESRLADGIARNTGVRAATGEYLAFLDGDDYWMPDKTVKQMAVLQADLTLEAVFGHVREFHEPQTPEQPRQMGDVLPAYVPGSLLIRRTSFLRIGYFDEQYKIGSVTGWFLHAQEKKLSYITLPDVVLYRRIHADNLGRREKARQHEYVRVIKAALDRRRLNGKGNS